MTFSGCWLTKLKRRWGLKSFTCHGESFDADSKSVSEAFLFLRNKSSA